MCVIVATCVSGSLKHVLFSLLDVFRDPEKWFFVAGRVPKTFLRVVPGSASNVWRVFPGPASNFRRVLDSVSGPCIKCPKSFRRVLLGAASHVQGVFGHHVSRECCPGSHQVFGAFRRVCPGAVPECFQRLHGAYPAARAASTRRTRRIEPLRSGPSSQTETSGSESIHQTCSQLLENKRVQTSPAVSRSSSTVGHWTNGMAPHIEAGQ